MTDELADALRPLLDRLTGYLRDRPDLRAAVADIGRVLLACADATESPRAEPPVAPPVVEPTLTPAPPPPPPPPVDLSQLDLAAVFRPPPPQPVVRDIGEIVPQGLPLIARRCRMKAAAARLVSDAPTGIDRTAANGLIIQANGLSNCFLWMLDPGGVYSDRPAVWADLAWAFEAAAAAADLLHLWDLLPESDARRSARDVLYLAAEAQGVLYSAVNDTGRRGRDQDQLELYISIKDRTKRAGVFVDRHMTLTDPVDAARGADVARRAADLAASLRESEERVRQRKKALDRLRHKTRRLRDDPAGAAEEWPRVVELLDELVEGGLPPSHPEVRDWLLPVLDRISDDVPLTPHAGLVFREIDRFIASRPNGSEPPSAEAPTAEVTEVRNLLAGRQVVLIGGIVRPDRKDALARAFDLDDVLWTTTVEHESVSVFEAAISRPEVAVVLLAIRWSSHSYGEVQAYCERYGKLLVRLPGGYHPNQVAHQILTQVGDRLRLARTG
jgi:hypothetical protein